ncbi:DDB1- and CUL4-associated factor 8 [Bulinus truncatus]|nr:DDB1- and CUL4-associated factor 8 [Bulinus truncatus]
MDSPESPERIFSSLARELKSIALNNINYFQNGKHSHHAKFHVTFCLLYEYIDVGIEPCYLELCKHLASCSYDFSEQVKGNGYRSLLKVVHKCCMHLLQLCKYISAVRDSILFRKKFYAKELESYVSALGQLRGVLYYSIKLINYCNDGELFADEESLNNEVADQLVLEVETLCQEPFYGRCLGFQFCDSMYKPVQALAIAMASYSEGYLETSQMMQVASSVFNSGKYFLDPELRAQQVVKVTRTADIKFCKAFWGFSESSVMQQLPMFVCPSVEVNEVITLGPDAFKLPLVDGSDTVDITPPCAHTGPGHVYTRLISAHLREGQGLKKGSKVKSPGAAKPKAAGLVIHIHGGGFVAQSSKSHEVYLREWAVTVDAPILSVDYSLAPEFPFPRALEECFYAYAWAINNCDQLGHWSKSNMTTDGSDAKFMPFSGDCHVISCARDGQVRLAELSLTGVCKATRKLAQHRGAVHKLALELDSPNIFLSCGEDALTYLFDLRQEKPHKLVITKENEKKVPLYSIHSNPCDPRQFCVGGRDHYVRVYDKRKINEEIDGGVLKRFCPDHLVNSEIKANITCACYNYNGTEILATYNDEDIYLFDNTMSDGANYTHKYTGHRNNATAKNVNFYGPKSEFIVSGSDCGYIYFWDKETEAIINFQEGDDAGVVNVLEPHPTLPFLATSGLDHDVKLWMPYEPDPEICMDELRKTVKKNFSDRCQERKYSEPEMIGGQMLWFIMHHFRNSARRRMREEGQVLSSSDDDNSSRSDDSDTNSMQCAQS